MALRQPSVRLVCGRGGRAGYVEDVGAPVGLVVVCLALTAERHTDSVLQLVVDLLSKAPVLQDLVGE